MKKSLIASLILAVILCFSFVQAIPPTPPQQSSSNATTIEGLQIEDPEAADDGKYLSYNHATTSWVLATPPGGGDMLAAVWDGDSNGFIDLDAGGTNSTLTDPGADRIMFWDESSGAAGAVVFGTLSTGLTFSGTVLTLDTELQALSGLTSAANTIPYFTGSGTAGTITSSANMVSLLGSADYATARTNLGLAIGTNVQAYDAELAAIAGLTFADASVIQLTGAAAAAVLTSGGNHYFLKSTSDNSAIQFASPADSLTAIGAQGLDSDLTAISGLTVTRGDIIVGNSSPAWTDLAIGSANTVLITNGTDPSWGTVTSAMITNDTITAGDLAATLTFADGDLLDLSGITHSGAADEGIALPVWANVVPTTDKKYLAADGNNLKLYNGGWVTIGSTGAPTDATYWLSSADATLSAEVNLGALTTGLVYSTVTAGVSVPTIVSEGLAIDLTSSAIAFDPTELTGNRTWAAGGAASIVWTWDNSGSIDPTLTFGDGLITSNSSVTVATGKNITIGTTQWNSSDEIDGTKIKDADYGDINVSEAGAWTIESGAIGVSEIAASTSAALYGVISDETGSSSGALAVFNINPSLTGVTIAGDITSTATAVDWDVADDNASALSIDAGGKAGILNVVTTNSNEGVSFSGFISLGADPADATTAANILMSNATSILFEADAAGTDVNALSVNSSEAVLIGSAGASAVTITPDTTITGDLTVSGADITLKSDGVKLTGSNGSLTILGLGDGYDEDVKIDLNTTTNTIEITSPASSATTWDFNTLNVVTTGTLNAGQTTLGGDLILYTVNADPSAAGALRYDSTISGMTGGGLRWYDSSGLGVRLLVDLDTDPSNPGENGYVVAYSSSLSKFYMKEDATSGSPAWDTIGAPTANDEIDFGAYTIELNVTDFQVGDGSAANAVIFTGGAGGQFKLGQTGVQFTGDGDGAFTMLGLGDGSDEDLTINLDDTANTVSLSSSTGVDLMNFGSINIAIGTDPADSGAIRLANGAVIAFEDGTEDTITHVNDTGFAFTRNVSAATAFVPDAADGATLGTAALEFSDLYLADGGVIYFQNDQSVYLTPSAGTLTLTGAMVATSYATGASATPTLTLADSSASEAGTGDIKVDAATAGQVSTLRMYVDEDDGEDVLYISVGGTAEEVLFAKKIDLTSAGIENVGNIADDAAFSIVSSGGTVTVESVVFTAGALSSVTSITDGTASWSSSSLSGFTNFSGSGYLALGADPAEAGTIRLPNEGSIVWEDGTEMSITQVNDTGLSFSHDVYVKSGTTNYILLNAAGQAVYVGENDVTLGKLVAYGSSADAGGQLYLNTPANYDDTIEYYLFNVSQDKLELLAGTGSNGYFVLNDGMKLVFDESAANPDDADVELSASDGVFTIGSANGVNNENITIDLDATANTVTVNTTTGVTTLSFSAISLSTTGNLTVGGQASGGAKTYSVASGVTNSTQLSDVTGTITLVAAEVLGTLINVDTSGNKVIELPTPLAGYNTIINIAYAGIDVQLTSGVSCYVDGAVTAGATGATITTGTVSEYFSCWTIYDAAASEFRWVIRKTDD